MRVHVLWQLRQYYQLKINSALLPWPLNMSKNTTEHLLKVERAAQFLLRAPQATVPEAMRVVQF
jgi:hypothetical protein